MRNSFILAMFWLFIRLLLCRVESRYDNIAEIESSSEGKTSYE